MSQGDPIGDYLKQLTAQARSSLLIELERLEACGAELPGAASMLEVLRAEFRKSGKSHDRIANPSRHFFLPVEPLLADGAPAHDNSGRILRGSLSAIWEWISHDLLPTMAAEYVVQTRSLIAADKKAEVRKVAAAFQTKIVGYLDNALGSPEGTTRARGGLATYTTSSAAFTDLLKLMDVLRSRDALTKFGDQLPASIAKLERAQVAKVTALLAECCERHPEALPFALTLVGNRLKAFWQLIRLATKGAASKDAADVAATRYAIAVSMVLDRLEDKITALRTALKTDRVTVARDLLAELYDTEYALRVRIDHLDRSEWGARLDSVMNRIAALVDAELSRFPDGVAHVLGSQSLRRHRSLSGRLKYFGWKAHDLLTNGLARGLKLVGRYQPSGGPAA
ncbi:hypothetical protein [Bradyrhizobium sp.]|jgi:hypothetical protein|uniref:hypothetical protein n=1 Tax=Bradyrhizobium sp. TaxID=376 RepID=UPI003C25A8EC